jgi:hypothetical protein
MLRGRTGRWSLFYMIFKTNRGEGNYKTALLKKIGRGRGGESKCNDIPALSLPAKP